MMLTPTIRMLSLSEVEMLIDWAAGEGWNPGLHDAAAFQAADPEGFIGAFIDGELAAGISAVAYGNNFGFIGLYICRAELRGKGYGRAVWDAGMARLNGRTIGLDGVPEQQPNYRKMGFVPAYRTIRYSGHFTGRSASSAHVVPVTSELFESLMIFDHAFFPAPREAFLRKWLQPPHTVLACMQNGAIQGYGVARACRDGFKIGPLFAKDSDTAEALLSGFSKVCDGEIHIDVPDIQTTFIETLIAHGMSPGFETERMYRGSVQSIALDGVFGITTLELG